MPPSAVEPPFDQLLATAEAVARDRPEVDLELAREVFLEAATLLHNGLALDGLDEHDASAVVAGLCVDLVAADPGAAVRALPGDVGESWGSARPRAGVRRLPHRGGDPAALSSGRPGHLALAHHTP